MTDGSFHTALRKLLKDYQRNVLPMIRRKEAALSRGEQQRVKHRKAVKKAQKRARRAESR
jgi:hypothetical protein